MKMFSRLGLGALALSFITAPFAASAQTKIEFFFPVPVEGKLAPVVLMSANFNVDLKLSGDIMSLEPMLKADETTREDFLKDFWPALHANASVDGELYGVPFHNSTPLLYYNVEHFKEAGLDPSRPPRTWAELVDAAKKLTKGDRSGFLMPAGYDYLGWLMEAFSMSNGGRYFNEDYGA